LKRVLGPIVVEMCLLGCGTRTPFPLDGPTEPSADAGPDSGSGWLASEDDCECDLPDLTIKEIRRSDECGEAVRRSHFVENCGHATIEESVTVELWVGLSLDDPEAVLLDTSGTTPGMPGLAAEWIDFYVPWSLVEAHVHGSGDSFVVVDRLDLLEECEPDYLNLMPDAISVQRICDR
jgi:hypothetical protein